MKQRTIFSIIMAVLLNLCNAQQPMMKTLNDAQKLKEHEQQFVNKPLKTLLQEIGLPIKFVSANPSYSNQVRLGYFIFRFVEKRQYDSIRRNGKFPKQITVFVKEPFEWDTYKRAKENNFSWSKSDEEKYGDLTIVGIRVYGEN